MEEEEEDMHVILVVKEYTKKRLGYTKGNDRTNNNNKVINHRDGPSVVQCTFIYIAENRLPGPPTGLITRSVHRFCHLSKNRILNITRRQKG
jgi:hypothetical protein